MGSYWAYYELGWGGWWFWDPVENASFMPWLIGTAFIHSALVMEKRDALKIWIGEELVAEHGVQADGYSEERANVYLQSDEPTITVDVGVGDGQATIWTCDLTHGYIEINAGYRS